MKKYIIFMSLMYGLSIGMLQSASMTSSSVTQLSPLAAALFSRFQLALLAKDTTKIASAKNDLLTVLPFFDAKTNEAIIMNLHHLKFTGPASARKDIVGFYKAYGKDTFVNDVILRHLKYHEAGHATVALQHDFSIISTEVNHPEFSGASGRTHCYGSNIDKLSEMTLAGELCPALYYKQENIPCNSAQLSHTLLDDHKIGPFYETVAGGDLHIYRSINDQKNKMSQYLKNSERILAYNWPTVEGLVQALSDKPMIMMQNKYGNNVLTQKLTGDEIQEIAYMTGFTKVNLE